MGRRWTWYLIPAVAVLGALGVGGFFLLQKTADHIIIEQAERTSKAWAVYIGNQLRRIEAIAQGAEVTEEEQEFLNGARQFGDIFRFKLFDTQGRIRLISDDLFTDLANNPSRGEDNSKALAVARTGRPYSKLASGRDKPDRPDLYIETYVPVWRGDRMVAVTEVYMDRTEEAAIVTADILVFGWKVAGLVLLALSVPGLALILMTRKLRQQNVILNVERNKAQDAARAKSRFLAHMSHELRTPLNSIQGLSQVLLRGDVGALDTPKHREYVQDILESGDHLLNLINDLLDLSKVDFGKYDLLESNFDLGKCVLGALQVVRGWEAAQHLEISGEGLQSGFIVHADRRAVQQAVLNLLSNAVKFTPAGGKVAIALIKPDNGAMIIAVTDTGPGIPATELPHVFEPFRQRPDREYIAQHKGTGLGLSLVKALIELHGGSVSIESAVGRGTTVRLTLPPSRVLG